MKPLLAALLVLATIAACKDSGSHIYAGRLFEPARGCLDEATSVDIVDGANPGYACEKKCIATLEPADGGPRSIYVSSMCPPYPTFSDTTGTAPGCTEALAASDRSDLCESDGGTSNPPLPEAGPD
ncbi:MAG: hypothetical protein ABIP39_15210 [Polyangiaceae bacterium]